MNTVRLRYLLSPREVTNRVELRVLSVYRDHGVIPKDSRSDNFNKTPEDITRYQEVRVGDLVVNKMKAWQGSVGISDYHGIVSPDYLVCAVDPSVDSRFMHHLLRSSRLAAEFGARSKGIRPAQWRLYWEDLAEIPIMLPSPDEQRRIAAFLDAETARIDRLTLLRNLQVDKLSEALHAEAGRVTGLEWRKVPLRRIVDAVQTGTTPTELLQTPDPDNIPWYTPAALNGTLNLAGADKTIRYEDAASVPRFPAESILVVGIGESVGKVADLSHEATGNQQLTAIKISCSADRRFVAWRLFAAYDEIRAWAQHSRVRIINNDVLMSFAIHAPPLNQQIEIRKELDHRLADFTDFREAAARFARLASERRRALITAAVTGEIDVTTAAGGVAV